MAYRPDLGDNTKEETEKLRFFLQSLGWKGSEGETVAEAVRFTYLVACACKPREEMSWDEYKTKMLVRILDG